MMNILNMNNQYFNEWFCSECGYKQIESDLSSNIQLPCIKCGNNKFTSQIPTIGMAKSENNQD